MYEIFPDRFASSGLDVDAPDWAVRRDWDGLPTGRGPETPLELFGGDLRGVERHLDHVESLGANVIYLTPFFPAGSTHRYDATTFDQVDPLLGGDEALASLARAAAGRGIRLVGDLTLNHTGRSHEWFLAALAGSDAPGALLLLVRRLDPPRLRVVDGLPDAAEARLARRRAAHGAWAPSRAATWSRRSGSPAGASTWPT